MSNLKQIFNSVLLVVLLFSAGLVWYGVFTELGGDELRVVFLDVGQGDAVFVESSAGTQMLIDGGPNNKVLRALSEEMPFYDRSLDYIVATHPDADHINGLVTIMDRYEVDKVITPGVEAESQSYKFFTKAIKEEGAEKIIATRGLKAVLGEDSFFKVLFPDRALAGRDVDRNSASMITLIEHKENKFLLSGDAPQDVERYTALLEGSRLESDVLKLGHHGSETSSSKMFLGLTSPRYGVISAGEGNNYGHPDEEVINRLKSFGVETLSTQKLGNIEFISDGKEVELKEN